MLDFNNTKDRALFADRIKQARKNKGVTQQTLADMIGVKRETVTQWEKGNNLPDYGILSKLCEALDIDYGYLFGEYIETKYIFHEMSRFLGLPETVLKDLVSRSNEFRGLLTWFLIDNHDFDELMDALWLLKNTYFYIGEVVNNLIKTPDDDDCYLYNNFHVELQLRALSVNRALDNLFVAFNKKCIERSKTPSYFTERIINYR
ncbi:MAG: helix-turn-helix domain-containing protein [Lachnospiraceae bacterium]|nr:helix-turn-helix domain-containing protein [Lachnospiraceae bacterium]